MIPPMILGGFLEGGVVLLEKTPLFASWSIYAAGVCVSMMLSPESGIAIAENHEAGTATLLPAWSSESSSTASPAHPATRLVARAIGVAAGAVVFHS
jgi:hypothetical protein